MIASRAFFFLRFCLLSESGQTLRLDDFLTVVLCD